MLCQDASDPVWASVHELIRRYATPASFHRSQVGEAISE